MTLSVFETGNPVWLTLAIACERLANRMASSAKSADPDTAIQLGDLLRESRERSGLKLKDVAAHAGTSLTTLSLLERGRRGVSPDLLERIVSLTGADASKAFRMAGVVPPQAVAEVLGRDVAGALDRGGLTAASRRALRRIHLAELAASVTPRTTVPPVDPERLLFEEFGIEIRPIEGFEAVRFATHELIEYVQDLDDEGQRHRRNLLLGHMAGHALISRDAGRRPECSFQAGGTPEGEATWTAGLLLMPRMMLESEAQVLAGTYRVEEPSGLASFISEVAAAFAVPAWLAARHLGDAGLLAWSAGLEEA